MALSDEQYALFVLLSVSGGVIAFILQRVKFFKCGSCKIGLNTARNQPIEIPAILQVPPPPPNNSDEHKSDDDIESQQPPPPPPPPPFPTQAVLQEVIIPLAGEIIRRLSHDKS
jgi:hypothetical protein